MIDKIKYPELYKVTGDTIKMRRRYLREAIQSQKLCEQLPEEIKALHITTADIYGDELHIGIHNEEGTMATLKTLGIQGLKPQVSSWSKTIFYSSGEGKLPDGTILKITINLIDEPEGCEVVEKETTDTIYVLVCEKTGKEL